MNKTTMRDIWKETMCNRIDITTSPYLEKDFTKMQSKQNCFLQEFFEENLEKTFEKNL